MRVFLITAMLAFASLNSFAQILFEGKVMQRDSREILTGAYVVLRSAQHNYAGITDSEGNFSFRAVEGTYELRISFVGFSTLQKELVLTGDHKGVFELAVEERSMEAVVVASTRVHEKTPVVYTELSKQEIAKKNLGQDLTYLMSGTPSAVVTSDAGSGVGYTGLRIRGSDQTKINVTVNGIPLNDAESHNVFWVNMPDFSSSVENIQIQRGVGSSAGGSAAFGAAVNIRTEESNKEPYASTDNSFGSYGTRKHTVKVGTGLIKDRFAFDARFSKVESDGYIDRASSDLKSYFLSGSFTEGKHLLKFLTFGGKEKTYQSWYGVDKETLEKDRTFNYSGMIVDEKGRVSYYDNQTDNYWQNHYQLHYVYELSKDLLVNASLHYTDGRGYYESYKQDKEFGDYGLKPVPGHNTTDLVNRKWLDNDFYGGVFSVNYKLNSQLDFVLGGGLNKYDGDHFGKVIWMKHAGDNPKDKLYYFNNGEKRDGNVYAKMNYSPVEKLHVFTDFQYRNIDYSFAGNSDELRKIKGKYTYNFFNPKLGLSFDFSERENVYISYAMTNREPLRKDYIDAKGGEEPEPERLQDVELGCRVLGENFSFEANGFYMYYTNQFVNTGAINSVGAPIRTNSGNSYRTGLELSGVWKPVGFFVWNMNVSYSRNRNKSFKEAILAEDEKPATDANGNIKYNEYENTAISFSPDWVAFSDLSFIPLKGLNLSLASKYVGEQYMDNKETKALKLDDYLVHNLRVSYEVFPSFIKSAKLTMAVNNVTGKEYVTNGNGYNGTPYYFPQATRNYMVGLSLNF
ncbi:MAG: TonB-dependent receptor [Cytophagales bacterium]|nr:TonB-dependent receptor [Cytophagales bacterium]